MNEEDYLLAWSLCPGIGYVRMGELLVKFGSCKKAWLVWEKQKESMAWPVKLAQKVSEFVGKFEFNEYRRKMTERKMEYVNAYETDFPESLKLADPIPLGIYWQGSWEK